MRIGFRTIFREGENEGAGGGAKPDVGADRVAALEARLNRMGSALETIAKADETREHRSRSQQELSQYEGMVTAAAEKVAVAKKKLAEAYEAGEAAAIANASAELASATTEHTAANMQTAAFRRQLEAKPKEQPTEKPQTQQQIDDTNLRAFRDRNKDWYGINPEMTQEALSIDKEIRAEGILEVGSQQYFRAIEARLQRKFPDQIKSGNGAADFTTQRGTSMTSKPDEGGNARIPASVAASYSRMGFDLKNPEVVKSLVAARETAVQKGLLSATVPSDLKVITR